MDLEQFSLKGRTAVVTGGASGLGEAIARRFAAQGAHVFILDRNEEGAEAVASSLRGNGSGADAVAADVTDEASIKAAADLAVSRTGRLDVMVNMAGIAVTRRILDLDEALIDNLYAIHLKGTIWGTKHAIRVMTELGNPGSIINCASAAMDQAAEGLSIYSAMKAAIATFTRTAAREAGKLNIRCNVISPGLIVTAMTQRHGVEENGQFSEAKMAAFIDGVKKFNALDRVGEVDDIANAALYLATDASKYVTGQILRVNGGISMV